MTEKQEHVLGEDGQFHVEDEEVDLTRFAFEDWVAFALFWVMAAVVFYQVVTRYVMDDPAGWTEEIARNLLIVTVFIGGAISVRKNNHIQVDAFYRLLPGKIGRLFSTAIDVVRILFFGYAAWLTYLLTARIGRQQMAVIDLPIGIVYSLVLFGFLMMLYRAIGCAIENWRRGYSVLERPEIGITETL